MPFVGEGTSVHSLTGISQLSPYRSAWVLSKNQDQLPSSLALVYAYYWRFKEIFVRFTFLGGRLLPLHLTPLLINHLVLVSVSIIGDLNRSSIGFHPLEDDLSLSVSVSLSIYLLISFSTTPLIGDVRVTSPAWLSSAP